MAESAIPNEKQKPVCFVIMPISDAQGYDPGHFGRVYEHVLRPAIVEAGFMPIRADDTNKTDYIVVGIIQRVVDSAMVLCDYSARNPNVMYELGIRHAFNLPVTLVRDRRTDKVFDIQGLRYSDYDESLRVDSVQKDITKIAKAIRETATAEAGSYNSVVQLAGIKVAKIPEEQHVSPDTQLILSALSGLERRIDASERRPADLPRYFRVVENKIEFADSSTAELNEPIFDVNAQEIGTVVDIHPADEKIFVRRDDGKVISYSAVSVKSKGLTSIPF